MIAFFPINLIEKYLMRNQIWEIFNEKNLGKCDLLQYTKHYYIRIWQ